MAEEGRWCWSGAFCAQQGWLDGWANSRIEDDGSPEDVIRRHGFSF
jgi:hypothetical protein